MIAVELLAALFASPISKNQGYVLSEMILAMYGPDKAESHFIDSVQLSHAIGVSPTAIRLAVKHLEQSGVIILRGDFSHVFSKDWETWKIRSTKEINGVGPLIGKAEARFVGYCKSRFGLSRPRRIKRPLPIAKTFLESRRKAYREYLLSPEWQTRRLLAIEAAGGCCQVCNSSRRLDVHHRTYARIGGELPGDLITLCRGCHAIFHAHGRLARNERHADRG